MGSATARVARIDRLVIRLDAASAETDAETGFVRVWGQVVPVGLLEYGTMDGAPFDGWTELVPESTVFDEAANRTLLHAPITLQHPPEFLDSNNTNRYQIGSIIELAEDRAAGALRARHLVTDAPAIEAMRAGLLEISPGYTTRLVGPEGTFNGLRYDAVQTERRYNHVAIVTQARAGPGNILDRVDAVRTLARCFRADGLRIQVLKGDRTVKTNKRDAELTIGEDTFNVPEAVADAFRAQQASLDESAKALDEFKKAKSSESSDQGEGDEGDEGDDENRNASKADKKSLTLEDVHKLILKANKDAVSSVLKGLDEREQKVRADAKALAEIVAQARPLLPQSFKCDGRKASDIMTAAITEQQPKWANEAKAAVKADDMGRLRGLFDAARLTSGQKNDNTTPKLGDPPPASGMQAAIDRARARTDASRKGIPFKNGRPDFAAIEGGKN